MDIVVLLTYIKNFNEMTECTVFRAARITYMGTSISSIILCKNWNVSKIIRDVIVRLYRSMLRLRSGTINELEKY
jgi:hypothetical protein